jgi:hypothetical protein
MECHRALIHRSHPFWGHRRDGGAIDPWPGAARQGISQRPRLNAPGSTGWRPRVRGSWVMDTRLAEQGTLTGAMRSVVNILLSAGDARGGGRTCPRQGRPARICAGALAPGSVLSPSSAQSVGPRGARPAPRSGPYCSRFAGAQLRRGTLTGGRVYYSSSTIRAANNLEMRSSPCFHWRLAPVFARQLDSRSGQDPQMPAQETVPDPRRAGRRFRPVRDRSSAAADRAGRVRSRERRPAP